MLMFLQQRVLPRHKHKHKNNKTFVLLALMLVLRLSSPLCTSVYFCVFGQPPALPFSTYACSSLCRVVKTEL